MLFVIRLIVILLIVAASNVAYAQPGPPTGPEMRANKDRAGGGGYAGEDSNGNVPIIHGGTGASTAGAARTSLGAAASGANSDITRLLGLTTPISPLQGGTGLISPGTVNNCLVSNGTQWVSTGCPGGGGGGTNPGGADTNVQINSVGLFAGTSDLTHNLSTRTTHAHLLTLDTALGLASGGTSGTDAPSARAGLGLGALAVLGAGAGLTSDGSNLNVTYGAVANTAYSGLGGLLGGGVNPVVTTTFSGVGGAANAVWWSQHTIGGTVTALTAQAINQFFTTDSITGAQFPAFTIVYTGAEASATISIDTLGSLLTLEAPMGTIVFQFDLSTVYTTFGPLVTAINTISGFSATLIANPNLSTNYLNNVSEQDVTTTYSVLYSSSVIRGMLFEQNLVSPWTGNRIGWDFVLTNPSSPGGGANLMVTQYSRCIITHDMGGTSVNPNGACSGIIPAATIGNIPGWIVGINPMEIDTVTYNSGTNGVEHITGINVAKYSTDPGGLGLLGRTGDTGYQLTRNKLGGAGWLVGWGNRMDQLSPYDQVNGRMFWAPVDNFNTLTRGPYIGQPQNQIKHGFDIAEMTYLGCPWRSPAYCVDNSGNVHTGQGMIGSNGANLSIDVTGYQMTSATLHSGGSGYIPSLSYYEVTPGLDAVLRIGTVGGVLTGTVGVVLPAIAYGSIPCSTACPITKRGKNFGSGATIDPVWRPAGIVQIANSGAATTIGGSLTVAGPLLVTSGGSYVPKGGIAYYGGTIFTTSATLVFMQNLAKIPANSLGTNGCFRVRVAFTYTKSSNSKTMQVVLSAGSSGTGGSVIMSVIDSNSADGTFAQSRMFCNSAVTGAQNGFVPSNATTDSGFFTGAPATGGQDTTRDLYVNVLGSVAGGDTLTLYEGSVEILAPRRRRRRAANDNRPSPRWRHHREAA